MIHWNFKQPAVRCESPLGYDGWKGLGIDLIRFLALWIRSKTATWGFGDQRCRSDKYVRHRRLRNKPVASNSVLGMPSVSGRSTMHMNSIRKGIILKNPDQYLQSVVVKFDCDLGKGRLTQATQTNCLVDGPHFADHSYHRTS